MSDTNTRLSAEKLRRICDPGIFDFDSTADVSALEGPIGQDRAVRAIAFGIAIESPGYHAYALGPVGTGRTTTIRNFLTDKAAAQPTPNDWCYVNNFEDPDKPFPLWLPAGRGRDFQGAMEHLVEDLQAQIVQAFESEEYQNERKTLQDGFQERGQNLFREIEKEATSKGFVVIPQPHGLAFAPIVGQEVMSLEQLSELSEQEQERIRSDMADLQDTMRKTLHQVLLLQKEMRSQLHELDRRVAAFAIQHLFDELKLRYADIPTVLHFLDRVRADVLDNIALFRQEDAGAEAPADITAVLMPRKRQSPFDRYSVNLIIDNSSRIGAPIIFEDNPNYHNLLGRIEHEVHLGALITDFTMIKAGALHRANGGYLMIEARDLLTKPFAWSALKRALNNKEIRIEIMAQEYQTVATRTLEPGPIPLDIKVILIGDPLLYYLLYNLDEEFRELFKVKADFAVQMDWNDDTAKAYAQFIGSICRAENLQHFAPSGVAKLIEHSARMVSDQTKLSTKFGEIVDLIRQASFWAAQGNGQTTAVTAEDVMRAIQEKVYRSNSLEERLQEMIETGALLIDTTGEAVGQVNGTSVLSLGDYSFGKPSRITARTFVGSAGMVNIDREIELGGRIHNKGYLILVGYLGGKYATELPLTLSASITFEQLYEEVEGDSAASAELYALLSSLSGFPVRQDLAVTGSVNQHGHIQAIGGVNEKIEGFFDVCKTGGLTGTQGVIIPKSNVKNLMLREDVVAAVQAGQFHVYAITTVDEGMALLTGQAAGEKQSDGTYPEGTINRAVQDRLYDLAEKARTFLRTQEG